MKQNRTEQPKDGETIERKPTEPQEKDRVKKATERTPVAGIVEEDNLVVRQSKRFCLTGDDLVVEPYSIVGHF